MLLAALSAAFLTNTGSCTEAASLDHVREAVVQYCRRLERLYVHTTSTSFGGEIEGTHRVVLACAPGRGFIDCIHGAKPDQHPWMDPARFQIWFDQNTIGVFPFQRVAYIESGVSAFQFWDSPYRVAIGWHPYPDPFRQPTHLIPYLDELFEGDNLNRLAPTITEEMVDGVHCFVISGGSGSDVVWLAPSLGFAPMKRITALNDSVGRTTIEYRCRNHRMYEHDLYLPTRVEVCASDSREIAPSPTRILRLEVVQLAVNTQVPDSLFKFVPQAGTLTINRETDRVVACAGGGTELLDTWAVFSTDVCLGTLPGNSLLGWPILAAATAVGFCCAVLTLGGVAVFVRRNRRNVSRQNTREYHV